MDIEKQSKEVVAVEASAAAKEENQLHTLLMEIRDTLTFLDKVVINKQTRTITKITKNVRKFKKVIAAHHVIALYEALALEVPSAIRHSPSLNPAFSERLEVSKSLAARAVKTLQLEGLVRLLAIEVVWKDGSLEECLGLVEELLGRVEAANRRSLDHYSALLHYYFSRIHEKQGRDQGIRERLLEALNRACVRSDEIGQSTIFNLLLRNYLRHSHLEAAFNLVEKCSFPEGKSNNEFCKYLYYTGRVKAVRREYGDALEMLNQAIRKSPDTARGFKITCQKAAIVVELLLGEIPNREIFSDAAIFTNVYHYYKLIQVVLEGELSNFHRTVELHRETYQRDGLYTIILRLNQIVIRIGLRKISLAYSRIALADIATKLNIPAEDVEFVVAKSLRDGIMQGEIDHETQVLKIEGDQNIYVTHEPQKQLDKRVRYCLGLYHEVQRAITYPDMKLNVEEFKEEELDAAELLNLLDFDDDM